MIPLLSIIAGITISTLSGCGQVPQPVAGPTAEPAELPSSRVDGVTPPGETAKDGNSITPSFTNVAARLGVDFSFYPDRVPGRFFLPEVMGGGVAILDMDRDGWQDLYFMNGAVLEPLTSSGIRYGNGVFRNLRSLGFQNVSQISAADDDGYGQGCLVGDFNTDGFPDLYLTNFGPNTLLFSNGDGTFVDVTESASVDDPSWGTSGVAVDLNGDELLDIFVANYMDVTLENNEVCSYGESVGYCGPGKYDGIDDLAYVNNGDGTFDEQAAELGFRPFPGKGLAVGVSDFNSDFRPEIYVGNDMDANFLFTLKSKDGEPARYHDVAASAGCAVSAEGMNEASMGVAIADYDCDGEVDIYLTHYYQMKNSLYRNLGAMLFEDDSYRSHVAATSFQFLGFGVIPIDFNRDSSPDLFMANGHVLGGSVLPNAMTPQLLLNDGNGAFSDISKSAGPYFEDAWLGRGVAGVDFDDDGDLDVCVSHIDRPVALLRNDTSTGAHFVGVELLAADGMPPHCARVTVRTSTSPENTAATQIVGAGGSYLSSSDTRLLFAVSDPASTELTIEWPSRKVETFDVSVDQYHRVVEGRGVIQVPK